MTEARSIAMHLEDLRCDDCGAAVVLAVAPGIAPRRSAAVRIDTRRHAIVEPGEADRAWCETCWRVRFDSSADGAREAVTGAVLCHASSGKRTRKGDRMGDSGRRAKS
jgi:hypothetical protein